MNPYAMKVANRYQSVKFIFPISIRFPVERIPTAVEFLRIDYVGNAGVLIRESTPNWEKTSCTRVSRFIDIVKGKMIAYIWGKLEF